MLYRLKTVKLQIFGVELHVADFLDDGLLNLVAVLLGLFLALLNWLVCNHQALLHVTHRLDGPLLALVTDLPGLFLAVLGVAVLLGLLRANLHLQFADLLWLKVTVLFLHWEGEDVGELLAVPVDIGLTHLNLDLSRDVITILLRFPRALNLLLTVTVILRRLNTPAVKLNCVGASYIVNNFLFHVTVGCLDIATLVVILGDGVNLVGGVAYSVLPSEALLNLVSLFESLVVDVLNQVTNQLINIEADTLNIGLDDPSAVFVHLDVGDLLVLGVRLALVDKYYLLNLMAVRVLVDSIASNVGLANVRVILLNCCWSRIDSRRWWWLSDWVRSSL